MTFEEAIKKSIKQYMDDSHNDEDMQLHQLGDKPIYNKAWFDDFEDEIKGKKAKPKTLQQKIKDVKAVDNSKVL